jgi:hypothetical protein
MKKTRLFEFMKNKRFELTDSEFEASAEPNPFTNPKKSVMMADDDITGKVRLRGKERYHDLVNRIDALDKMLDAEMGLDYDEKYKTSKDEDDYYLNTKDRSYRKNEFNDEEDVDDIDADAGWAFMRNLADGDDMGDDFNMDLESDEQDMGVDTGMDADPDSDMEDDMEGQEELPYEGIVRAVKGAYLVSKKEQADETFTEVWMYNVGKKYDDEANIRKAILSGTDIDPTKNFSEDGTQEAVITSVGNVQFLTLVGIPD